MVVSSEVIKKGNEREDGFAWQKTRQLSQVWRKSSNGHRDLHDHMWKFSGLGIHVGRVLDDLCTHYLLERVLSRTPQSLSSTEIRVMEVTIRAWGWKELWTRWAGHFAYLS